MQTAALNRWGWRQISARELNAPIDAPATMTACGPRASAWIAGTTSWATASWNWLNSHIRCDRVPSRSSIARPATLSQEYTLIRPASISGARCPTSWLRSTSSASPPAVGKSSTGTP